VRIKIMKKIVVTNNPLVIKKLVGYEVDYHQTCYLGVLVKVRDRVHLGHALLTHPLAGSVKPNDTPYRSVVMSREAGSLIESALSIIEDSIETYKKFSKRSDKGVYSESVLMDFQYIDYDLIFGKDFLGGG
jgi:hypothetical protein